MNNRILIAVCLALVSVGGPAVIAAGLGELDVDSYTTNWAQAMSSVRAELLNLPSNKDKNAQVLLQKQRLERDFPMESDWLLQDFGPDLDNLLLSSSPSTLLEKAFKGVLDELGSAGEHWQAEADQLLKQDPAANNYHWLQLYQGACEQRRRHRLSSMLQQNNRIVFTKHYNLGGSHYAYTEGQSDAQNERHFVPGAYLCLLEMNSTRSKVRTLLQDKAGVMRDPDVSWDGKHILFSWKKSNRADDYHLYELDPETGQIRQLTSGLGFADYEGAYLPDGSIIFASTRCVQTVDCWWTEVSNLYTCDRDGQYLRRLTFDQVHDNYPTVLDDGRIIYTRWEYNDRGQIYVQSLFRMNPDGTGQAEFYGNNSWFPTTILHARGIPGTQKVLAIFSGHHTLQAGKLGVLDCSLGNQENLGAQLVAPYRETPAVHVDAYGQEGPLFQYPYPLSATECLVSFTSHGWSRRQALFQIYWMHLDGRRELLVADPNISCNQPAPLRPRTLPQLRPSRVDFRQTNGLFYVENVYAGEGLRGIPRGTIKRLRVIALEYRLAGIGNNYNHGPAGAALSSTPVSIGNGCWDVKWVLGDANVFEDGSAFFSVPARTPVYFQALDTNGYAVQSMRSWSTLQPGETFSCAGCHESKQAAPPPARRLSAALKAGPQPLTPFYGLPRGFSFTKEIQPILDRHCISCHYDSNIPPVFKQALSWHPPQPVAAPGSVPEPSFSLLARQSIEPLSKRCWSDSYLALTQSRPTRLSGETYISGTCTPFINWINPQSAPPMLPPYSQGAARSQFLTWLKQGHGGVKLSREELDKLACWIDLVVPYCGDYSEANAWSPEELQLYQRFLQKRKEMERIEGATFQALRTSSK